MMGPVSSGYPGRTFTIFFIVWGVGCYSLGMYRTYRRIKYLGKLDLEVYFRYVGGIIFGSLIFAFIICSALWMIYIHWPL